MKEASNEKCYKPKNESGTYKPLVGGSNPPAVASLQPDGTDMVQEENVNISQLSLAFHSLTPTEISICNMIRNGIRTKEIAEMRGVSETTINRHREKIRRKLKITNQDVNLATFLQSSMLEAKWKPGFPMPSQTAALSNM